MGDYYGQLTYSDSFDAESEVKEIKENLEANGKQIEGMNSNFQKQKCAIIMDKELIEDAKQEKDGHEVIYYDLIICKQ